MASQRSRGARGAGRNNGGSGEEHLLWVQIQEELRAIVDEVNVSNDNTRELMAQDSFVARNAGTENTSSEIAEVDAALSKLDTLLRGGVKITESLLAKIKGVMDKVGLLRAVQKGKEDADSAAIAAASSSRERGAAQAGRTGSARLNSHREKERDRKEDREKDKAPEREREKVAKKEDDKDVYDFDAGGDSPVPSPSVSGHTRKLGSGGGGAGSDRSARDSVPPRERGDRGDRADTPANSKAGSAEPQLPPSAGVAGTAIQRSKVTFAKGQDVAFKPKSGPSEQADWYLGRVQAVLGEGKSRRYKVRDEDPEMEEEKRAEYRTSASSMIPIPNAGTDLPGLEKGKTVLAMYPSTTTFYKAAVVGTDPETGKINLRFDGEETTAMIQMVERRYVLEYRV